MQYPLQIRLGSRYNSRMKKLAVIAGCGAAMGRSIARAFAQEGLDLALIARSKDHLKQIGDEIAGETGGISVETYPGDLTDPGSVHQVFEAIRERQGDPDVLVYNLATMVKTPPAALTAQEILDTLPAMFFGALYTTAEVLPGMRKKKAGTLLYTGGGFGILPAQFSASHSVGKAALRNWVQNLHQELSQEGIHAATVTITRPVSDGGEYDKATIARHYVELHVQRAPGWDWEIIHKEL